MLKLKTKQIVAIYTGLDRLMESGSKPLEAMRRLSLGEGNPEAFFAEAAAAMEQGETLSNAMAKAAPGAFPQRDLGILEAAELTGSYVDSLRRLVADHQRRIAVFRKHLILSAYPALIVHVTAAAAVALLYMGLMTPMMIAGFLLAVVPFYGVVLTAWSFMSNYRNDAAYRDRLLSSRFLGKIVKYQELGDCFRLLYTLYAAGIRLDEAANRAVSMISAASLKGRVKKAFSPLEEGEPFTACLEGLDLPDVATAKRLSVGEETGNLEEALKETAEELEECARKGTASLLLRAAVVVGACALLGAACLIVGFYVDRMTDLTDQLDAIQR